MSDQLVVIPPGLAKTGLDNTRGQRIHPDIVLAQFQGQGAGQHIDGGLTNTVNPQTFVRGDAIHRGNVKDGSAALFNHHFSGQLRQQKIPFEVGVHNHVKRFLLDVYQRSHNRVGGGVIDQDVKAAKLGFNRLDELS